MRRLSPVGREIAAESGGAVDHQTEHQRATSANHTKRVIGFLLPLRRLRFLPESLWTAYYDLSCDSGTIPRQLGYVKIRLAQRHNEAIASR